jgi:hypothetical protein
MMSSRTGLSDLVHDLRTTLEAISEGLVEGLPDRLLDAEPRLAEIAARLAGSRLDPATTTIPREDVLAARAALQRCEQLGATIRTLGEVYAAGGGYDRHGHYPAPETTALLQARG